jgi:hypothetical protein
MNEPRVYKNSPLTFIVIVVLFAFLIGALFLGVGIQSMTFMLPVVLAALAVFGIVFLARSSSVVITDDEITARTLFGEKTMRWSEIHTVSGRRYGIKLHNFDGDVTVSPSTSLPGYEQIVDWIGTKRPDLFSPQEYAEMRRGMYSYVLIGLALLLVLGGGVAALFLALDSSAAALESLAPLVVFMFIALVIGMTALSVPQVVTLDGSSLTLKYLFSGRTLRAHEIRIVQLSYTQSRNGKHYFIALHLTNGKQIRISGLAVSLPIAYLVLKNWHTQRSPNAPEKV